ncbi:MAG: N-acetyl-gamma-glutamyl-phosphate reductase [Gammaproteobacteria bacterium]|nr:N-acetyl-gamma-glutamyl-phosphate reductase [Gammaproteobacteria bacterium]
MIKAGIVGATGYTGLELVRLLAHHPEVSLEVLVSQSQSGKRLEELYPYLRGKVSHSLQELDTAHLAPCDVVFFATNLGVAMQTVPELLKAEVRCIDLSADFRLKDPNVWGSYYGMPHACPEILGDAIYGLPEINRSRIAEADLVANPGCYPTAIILGFLPLLEQGWIDPDFLVADAKSGLSGAGRQATSSALFCEANDNFKAYAASGHRHWPEIHQALTQIAKRNVDLTFVPHVVPMNRGIHATLYAELTADTDTLQTLYEERYREEPFVEVLPIGSHPETRQVRGSNHCHIAVHRPHGGQKVVVLSVIDNLVKGAAGQAVQNMNIMFNLEERLGLDAIGLFP